MSGESLTAEQQHVRDELSKAFRAVLATEAGKRALFSILEDCAIYSEAFSGDNNQTNFNLGLQAAGRRMISRMNSIDPHLYPTLLNDMATIRHVDAEAIAAIKRNQEPEDYE